MPIDVEEWATSVPIDVDTFSMDAAPLEVTPEVNPDPAEQGSTEPANAADPDVLFQCGICSDTLYRPVVTLCMHIFCDQCFRTNLRYSFVCPYCRCSVREAPLRDFLFEAELQRAIYAGAVVAPAGDGRNTPYVWTGIRFPNE
ncbi:hypothetical protein DFH09DRAFT_1301007 [Mycena vulgaris]|nr:hypothetical protein DFH09DRAFT_1301007 [Mycena vulgaris]